jgi:Ca2+-dependent lipid-binding protein
MKKASHEVTEDSSVGCKAAAAAPPSLDVRIVEARCLPDGGFLSKPSYFAVLSYNGRELARTAVQENTTDPHWNHAFTIDHVLGDGVPLDGAQIGVSVVEKRSLRADAEVGRYDLSLAGISEGEVVDKWLTLKSAESGEIRLRVKANGFGAPRAAGAGAVVMGKVVEKTL